jgi:hypothetical protein
MRTRVSPALVQVLQFHGTYSFYLQKWTKTGIRHEAKYEPNGFKRDLVMNARRFILDMMPAYFKDMLKLPLEMMKTKTERRNPYFLVEEAK